MDSSVSTCCKIMGLSFKSLLSFFCRAKVFSGWLGMQWTNQNSSRQSGKRVFSGPHTSAHCSIKQFCMLDYYLELTSCSSWQNASSTELTQWANLDQKWQQILYYYTFSFILAHSDMYYKCLGIQECPWRWVKATEHKTLQSYFE